MFRLKSKTLFVIAFLSMICTSIHSATEERVQVVYGSKDGWIARHAAEELCRYIELMTGSKPTLSLDRETKKSQRVFLVGGPRANPHIKQLYLSLEIPSKDDGFVIRSFEKDGCKYTVLAGETGVASLYAVYDYLERFCKVGFFEDGEYIPNVRQLPFEGANTVQQPHFEDRHYLILFGHWGLKKLHPQFWTFEEWKTELDFCAKKKINLSRMHLRGGIDTFRGDVATRAFPEIGPPKPGYSDSAGWPNTYNWPEEYRTRLTKQILDYGRSLGIRFQYLVSYGDIPLRFREMHPEIEYMPDSMYGPSTQIRPADPKAAEVTKQYLRTLIDTFGTDHMYFDTPYSEDSPGATPGETLQFITDASLNLCKVLKDVDPEAIWVWDTWTFTVADITGKGEVWTDKNIRQYLDALPTEMTYIFDNNSDLASAYPDNRVGDRILAMYEQHDCFYDKRWAFAVLHSYAGDDTPHGDIPGLIERVQNLVQRPNNCGCVGLFTVPEKIGDNDLFYQVVLSLAWDPMNVDLDSFIGNYAIRRFGHESAPVMAEGLSSIVEGVHRTLPDDMNYCYYTFPGYGQPHAFPIFTGEEEYAAKQYDRSIDKMDSLRKGLFIILEEKDHQKDNPLYENTVLEYGKHYLAQLCNCRMLQAFAAFSRGDSETFERQAVEILGILDAIETILGSREDYVVQNTIDQAMSVEGTNPATPRMIRQNMINGNYMLNDNYEQIRMLYKPRVNGWLARMRANIDKEDRRILWPQLEKDVAIFAHNWIEGPLPRPLGKPVNVIDFLSEALVRFDHRRLPPNGISFPADSGE